ncbi:MAG: sugar transferase [Bacteroidales bacterium]|nr:sugar transferase [Bacteroidales bacterium]
MKRQQNFRLRNLIYDIIIWLLVIAVVALWRITSNKAEILPYFILCIVLMIIWVTAGYFIGRYQPPYQKKRKRLLLENLYELLVTMTCCVFMIATKLFQVSPLVFVIVVSTVWLINMLYLFIHFAIRYATSADVPLPEILPRDNANVLFPQRTLTPEKLATIQASVLEQTNNQQVLDWLMSNTPLNSSNTILLSTADTFNIKSLVTYRYDCYINLKWLNDVLGLNQMFCAINNKLPDNGLFCCCFVPQDEQKKQILARYPKGINYIIYTFIYLIRRVLPKILLTSRVYFSITKGKRRSFSKTEILGRLYYCGFEVVTEHQIGNVCYVVARRAKQPEPQEHKIYGPLITLNRVGKDGKRFKVYKMRTMHPYSEYLQAYMYDKVGLQEGGKIANDIRVSTIGAFMRKCWLDELPMFINLFKGDMKLVGVRPLSNHYFSLYTPELQEKRIKFRPGLLPPFYADMPKTLDEIQASEMRYLTMCEEKGCFRTDVKYLFLILKNIIFKKARSH